MDYKSHKFLKYLATIGSVILSIALLIIYLQKGQENKKIFNSLQPFIALEIILLILGSLSLISYMIVRWKWKNKSEYEYNKKDIIYLIVSFSLYSFAIIINTLYFTLSLTINSLYSMKILFYVLLPIIFLLMIIASIFETLSRIDEQMFLYKKEYEKIEKENKVKIIPNSVKKENNVESQIKLDDDQNPFKD
ncbi:MFS transporter [Mycoplasma sp. HU2014]|uniref:MFS transporter n=1 Tax=Mycoplasma sp. HU2014 TaxID=1664275 RepID=UPI00067D9ED2|nr:MFS transporter [Mycoplasma sp. HU2014]KNG79366.1 membrane protein [Mycoplasma sp. HU2014]